VLGAIRTITEQAMKTKLVVFTAFEDVDKALRAIDAGAHGYVLKGRPTDDLHEAIDFVRRGEIFISPGFAQTVVAGFRNRSKRDRDLEASQLSPREDQIVSCLLEGKSNKEIARTLGLSEKTIKHYMTNLMNKLRVKSRLEVVVAARSAAAAERF
jgi:DNA-binding NarL/FixJ family response regulator